MTQQIGELISDIVITPNWYADGAPPYYPIISGINSSGNIETGGVIFNSPYSRFGLETLIAPIEETPHTIRAIIDTNYGATYGLALFQEGVLIAEVVEESISDIPYEKVLTLTPLEVANITDYSKLEIGIKYESGVRKSSLAISDVYFKIGHDVISSNKKVIKVGNDWKNITNIKAVINGEWKNNTSIKVKSDNTWKNN